MGAREPGHRYEIATHERAKVTQVTAPPVHSRLFADTSMPNFP
jgi:hypothetical protein